MAVLDLEQLKQIAQGFEIEITHWDGKQKINVLVKQLDISKELLKNDGMLSNFLKPEVLDKFQKKSKHKNIVEGNNEVNTSDIEVIKEMLPDIDEVVKQVLVKPTYQDFESTVPLNLNQKLELFNFSLKGLDTLKKNND
ncbi:hypothetical protein [Romboutsia sp.]|uniref:hypothetical protein n=1 Tax=Romboutsia sp. TaxID=1965302 RepID=UPI002D180804|nr:hypothetical protein [Romboutsia sp.]HSQ88173.1 hypothetical protein [Romboutsia sp.]